MWKIKIILKQKKAFKNFFLDKVMNVTNKKSSKLLGSGIALTNNETEYIAKIIEPLENRRILLKGITEKSNRQERGFLGNFLAPLTEIGLPLMKNLVIQMYSPKAF